MPTPTLTQLFTSIADSIRSKKGMEASEKINAVDFPQEIDDIMTGGMVESKDVDFIDYDGTTLYSYTIDEIQELTELPKLPSHKGLICEGWNWTLAELKDLNDKMIVGASYITDDGATRLYLNISNEAELSLNLNFFQYTENGVKIDWGDGSPIETSSIYGGSTQVTVPHTYPAPGNYVISLLPDNDCTLLLGGLTKVLTSVNAGRADDVLNMLVKLEHGARIVITNPYLQNSYGLKYVTIPTTMRDFGSREMELNGCRSLKCVVLPYSASYRCFYWKQCFFGMYKFE